MLWAQFAVGQDSVYGKYSGTEVIFDSLRYTVHLSLKQDGSFTMNNIIRDFSITSTGKWWKKGDEIKLKPKHSKVGKSYGLNRTFVVNIEGDRLI